MNVDPTDRTVWFYVFLALALLGAVLVLSTGPEPWVLSLLSCKTAGEIQALLTNWDSAGRDAAEANLGCDFFFIFGYVGFLMAATWRFVRKDGLWLIAFGRSLMAVPLVAGLADAVENFLLLDILRFAEVGSLEFIAQETLVAARWMAGIKYSLAALSLITIGIGIYKRIWLNQAKGWRSMTTALADDFANGGLSEEEEAFDWEQARMDERAELRRSRQRLGRSDDLDGAAPPIGLAFSGGGIRSATFNLGIVQALAKSRGLKCIDYLSVVSGGGYVGSWLSKWISEARGVDKVQAELEACCEGDPEPPQLSFLRRYSNYLTPKTGIFSADTWTTVATYLRNFLLNQVILAAGALTLLLIPRLLAGLFDPQRRYMHDSWPWWCMGIGAALTAWALLWTGFNLAHFDPAPLARGLLRRCRRCTSQGWIITQIVAPLALVSMFGAYWLHKVEEGTEPDLLLRFERWLRIDTLPDLAQWIVFAAFGYAAAWALSQLVSWLVRGKDPASSPSGRLSGWRLILWALPAGAVGGALLALAELILAADRGASLWRVIVFGPPLVVLVLLGAAVVHIGLMGTHLRTGRREWMARAGAWLLIFAGSWTVFAGVAVYGPVLVAASQGWLKTALASGWVASTIGGILAGRSRKSTGEGAGGGGKSAIVVQVLPYVFILGLITLLALGLDLILVKAQFGHGDPSDQRTVQIWQQIWPDEAESSGEPSAIDDCCLCVQPDCVEPANPGWGERFGELLTRHDELLTIQARTAEPLVFAVLFALVCILMARRVDINEYSMHHFYRNRLTRCYLGASTPERGLGTQLFTGFNPKDEIGLSELATRAHEGDYAAPLLIVNTALNLVHGGELAWQERKAASFVMTPLHCGFELPREQSDPTAAGNAPSFRRSTVYAAERRSGLARKAERKETRGLGLGTAMAISGAAVSPNMGYHSSPALTFLLTVFNVRLGWWLGNPGNDHSWRYSGPRFGLFHLLAELFGQTSAESDYVYLSDGGHFENTGIYELVRRRCKVIIACDCGADPERKFADLGNAVRKCRVDLRTDIRFDNPVDRDTGASWALATIDYPGDESGTLVLIKPTLRQIEPEDVRSYSDANDDFPQQTTGDQWFDESQFESYRMLGYTIGREVFGDDLDDCAFVERLRGGPASGQDGAADDAGTGDARADDGRPEPATE